MSEVSWDVHFLNLDCKEIDFFLNKNLNEPEEQNSRWLKTKNHRNALMLANFVWFAKSAPTVNSLLLGATRSETVTSLESSNLGWGLFQMQFVMSNNMYQPHFLHAVGKNWLKHPETCPCPGFFPKHCRAKGAMFANHPANRTWLRSTRLQQLKKISAWMLKKLHTLRSSDASSDVPLCCSLGTTSLAAPPSDWENVEAP